MRRKGKAHQRDHSTRQQGTAVHTNENRGKKRARLERTGFKHLSSHFKPSVSGSKKKAGGKAKRGHLPEGEPNTGQKKPLQPWYNGNRRARNMRGARNVQKGLLSSEANKQRRVTQGLTTKESQPQEGERGTKGGTKRNTNGTGLKA